MSTSCNLDKDVDGKLVEENKYEGMIGPLLYVTASHVDIMFDIYMPACFQASLKASYLNTAKHIMRYFFGTQQVGLWYPKGPDCDLVGDSDSNFSGCKLDSKSISGTCHLLGNSLVSQQFKKQASVALSINEEKYIVIGSCCGQLIWMKQ